MIKEQKMQIRKATKEEQRCQRCPLEHQFVELRESFEICACNRNIHEAICEAYSHIEDACHRSIDIPNSEIIENWPKPLKDMLNTYLAWEKEGYDPFDLAFQQTPRYAQEVK